MDFGYVICKIYLKSELKYDFTWICVFDVASVELSIGLGTIWSFTEDK